MSNTLLETYDADRLSQAQPFELSESLEKGKIVYFPECPFTLADEQDLEFLRAELPGLIKVKNISYHPETDSIRGMDDVDGSTLSRVNEIFTSHRNRVNSFLDGVIPEFTRDWFEGTLSFRPIQEKGRNLKPHASNELVHVDAGAYGATHGDRVLRFFVNINPQEDRVWASKGTLANVLEDYAEQIGIPIDQLQQDYLKEGLGDRFWSSAMAALGQVWPLARVIDSSPYDREMRRIHNFMKDTPDYQQDMRHQQEFRFKPFSAWMVLTDITSHASLSGQFAFVSTNIVPLASCRLPEYAPINLLKGGRAALAPMLV